MTNKEKYRKFCEKEKNIPIFSKDWWLDSVCGEDNWDVILVENGEEIFASLPFYKHKKAIFDIITMPKLTQTIGVYIKYPENKNYYKKLSFEKDMMTQLIDGLPKVDSFMQNFSNKTENWLPFYWKGYTQTTRYSYIIEEKTMLTLSSGFGDGTKRKIKKTQKAGTIIIEDNNIELLFDLNTKTFARQGLELPYNFELIKKIYETCLNKDAVKVYFSKDTDGSITSAGMFVYDDTCVYGIISGVDTSKRDTGGMNLVILEVIKFAIESGRKFDFCGSMIESIEQFFRSFGAVQKPYFNISKTNSKILKIRTLVKEIIK